MREFLTENTLFNTVAMYIAESASLLLVVEGDDDHLALKSHTSEDLELLAGTGGREQVLRTASLARLRALSGVRFLVDRDYDAYIKPSGSVLDNVTVSTRHDLFMDLMSNDPTLIDRLIDTYLDIARRRGKGGKGLANVPSLAAVKNESFLLSAALAAVRIVDAKNGLGLDFRRFSFGELAIRDFSVRGVARIVLERNGYDDDGVADLIGDAVEVYLEITAAGDPPVGDHDFFSALARVLKRLRIAVRAETLHRAFIVGVACRAIYPANWYVEIQQWCALNRRDGFTCGPDLAIAV
jgi:hypothetical protein